MDLMNDDLFDMIHDIIAAKIVHLNQDTSLDTSDALSCLQIVSNMMEYIDYQLNLNNMTGIWKGSDN